MGGVGQSITGLQGEGESENCQKRIMSFVNCPLTFSRYKIIFFLVDQYLRPLILPYSFICNISKLVILARFYLCHNLLIFINSLICFHYNWLFSYILVHIIFMQLVQWFHFLIIYLSLLLFRILLVSTITCIGCMVH